MPSLLSSVDKSLPIDAINMQLESLELAGCSLDRFIVADNSRPSFLEISGVAAQRSATCSGLSAGDYRNLAMLLNHPNLSQVKVVNKVPLPPEIMEHFAHMQCHCLMGVFPEISRAWLTIDSNIYVWAFEHGNDVAYFDGLGETIVSVALIKPRTGVFQPFVKYLLILTTTVEIVVLGVTFRSNKSEPMRGGIDEMHLVPEPVFVLPTDGISMIVIKSTSNGRIFMGGKDGCLYEITYQAKSGWFGKHCKKVNHSTGTLSFLVPSFLNAALYDEDPITKIEIDNSRHILYTLSEKGSIEVFDLGEDGEGLSRVTKLTQNKIVSLAVDIVKTLEANNFKPVIAISAVDQAESEHLHLVAVTQTGVRMYFTTGYADVSMAAAPGQRPFSLTLLHVRMPPGFTPNASVMKPKQVHTAIYENNTLLMVTAGGGDSETLWCLSRVLPGAGAGGASFSEAHTLLPLDGPCWALTPLPTPPAHHLSPALLTKKDVWSWSRWVVVSGGGAEVVASGAAPELLRTLLRDTRGPDNNTVRDFFHLHNLEQACACALYLACEDTSSDQSISEWATRAFFLYGGQPTMHQIGQPNMHPAGQPTMHLGGQPNMPPASTAQHLPAHQMGMQSMSGQHMGPLSSPQMQAHHTANSTIFGSPRFAPGPQQISTPMSNMRSPPMSAMPQSPYSQAMSPQSPDTNHMMSPQSPGMAQSMYQRRPGPSRHYSQSFNGTQHQSDVMKYQVQYSAKHNALYIYVGRILTPIWQLKCVYKHRTPDKRDFLSSKITGEDCSYIVQRLQRVAAFLKRTAAPQQTEEQISLNALKMFVNLAIEMLNLWKILCEHQFHVVTAALPPEQQSALLAACFRELLVGGQEVAGLLLDALVAGYLRDNASVDGITHKLRQLCPTLYRQEDAACSKANELLLFAKQQKNAAEREDMLRQALKLCKDVAPNVNLPLVCSKLVAAGFYSGVVDLCVACAAKLDPHARALHFYRSDQPAHDHDGQLAYFRRMEVYREVCVALERLYERSLGVAGASGTGGTGGASGTGGLGPGDPALSPKLPAGAASDDALTLSPADANYQGRKLVCECLSRDDELLHVAVYEWLVSKRLGSELVCLGGAGAVPGSLRAYLAAAARAASPAAALPLLDLLWKVLERAGDHLAAAAVLEGLATRPGTGASLAQRMSWLSAGVVCVRGAGGAAPGDLLRRLEESSEVARVQAGVRAAALSLPRHLTPPHHQLQRLDDELLDMTQLYEEYADRYNLWECKLAIIQCSGHTDPPLVEDIWRHVVGEAEAAARALGSPDEQLGCVLGKVVALGKEYAHSSHCFPLYFIVRQLEILSCKLQADNTLVFTAILSIGISLEQVLDIYIKLISVSERNLCVWLANGDELHAAKVCTLLLERAKDDIPSLPASARRRTLAKCKDLLEATLSSLQAMPNTRFLIDRLTVTQAYLDHIDS